MKIKEFLGKSPAKVAGVISAIVIVSRIAYEFGIMGTCHQIASVLSDEECIDLKKRIIESKDIRP